VHRLLALLAGTCGREQAGDHDHHQPPPPTTPCTACRVDCAGRTTWRHQTAELRHQRTPTAFGTMPLPR
jgi:hypothetical protein